MIMRLIVPQLKANWMRFYGVKCVYFGWCLARFGAGSSMNLEEIIAAVDKLPPEDKERLKAHLAEEKPRQWKSGDEWLALLNAAVDEFWADTTAEEKDAIIEAMNMKS